MSPDLQQELALIAPKLFRCLNDKKQRMPIGWGIECGDGWFAVLAELATKLEAHINRSGDRAENFYAVQVKEKFGGLRFYTSTFTKLSERLIRKAESECYKICETCGQPGKLRDDGWWRTLCDKHEDERRKEMKSVSHD